MIKHELKAHLPFTLAGVTLGILLLFAFYSMGYLGRGEHPHMLYERIFHVSHFLHIFLSAIASTAMYLRREKNFIKAIFVGYFATLLFCGISDLLIPFIGGKLLGWPMHLHICLLETPGIVLLFNTGGIILGILTELRFSKVSYVSHSSHVLISSFASLLYLVSFGPENWPDHVIGLFIVTTLAVVLPCCSSDIVIPLSFVSGLHGHEHEDEHTRKS
ncbi:MAG: hypothetical protein H6757_00980 [Candidatus Omnitrophica bacterium]|nr:hypothetical protein [Candidatus Omnitrophota bacterium]